MPDRPDTVRLFVIQDLLGKILQINVAPIHYNKFIALLQMETDRNRSQGFAIRIEKIDSVPEKIENRNIS